MACAVAAGDTVPLHRTLALTAAAPSAAAAALCTASFTSLRAFSASEFEVKGKLKLTFNFFLFDRTPSEMSAKRHEKFWNSLQNLL